MKDIQQLEQVKRMATKYILNNYQSDYMALNMLPLMHILELQDIIKFSHKDLEPSKQGTRSSTGLTSMRQPTPPNTFTGIE